MKLKYYLRGMGIGIILTAIVMGFALGGRKTTISDAEVIERAKALGMVDGGVLSQPSEDTQEIEVNNVPETTIESEDSVDDSSASLTSLDKEGEEVSEEINQGVAGASKPLSEVAKEEKKDNTKKSEEKKTEASAEASSASQKSGTDKKTASNADSDDSAATTQISDNSSAGVSQEKKDTELTTSTASESNSTYGSTTSVTKTVTIPGGLGSEQVSAILQKEGVIDSAYSFNQYLCDRKMDRKIRSGLKTIPAGSSYEDIARIICNG